MSNGPNRETLIIKAAGGDAAALEELLLTYSSRLSRHVADGLPVSLQGVVGADDILQQTFVQAFRGIKGLQQRNERSFVAWLKAIANRQLQDAIKAQQRKKRGGGHAAAGGGTEDSMLALVDMLSDRHHTPARSVGRREAIQAIRIGIAGLPQDQRDAIRIHLLEGKSLDETAQTLQRSPGAIRALIQRGKTRLRDGLGRASQWLSTK